jgi:hypothetical protein
LKGCCRVVPDEVLEVCSKEDRRLEAEDNGCPQTDRWVIEEEEEEEGE